MNEVDKIVAGIAMREALARAATPGPWERGPRRNSSAVLAPLPNNEVGSWDGGVVPSDIKSPYAGQRERCGVVQVAKWSDHRFFRSRSGKDLDHVAVAADPAHVLAVLAAAREEMADALEQQDRHETGRDGARWWCTCMAGQATTVTRCRDAEQADRTLARLAAMYGATLTPT